MSESGDSDDYCDLGDLGDSVDNGESVDSGECGDSNEYVRSVGHFKWKNIKHRKNCECCHHHSVF